MRRLNVGVIGCGGNSDFHLMVYRSRSDVHLAAVCDIDDDKARAKAGKWGAERTYADFRSMLDLDLDLVDVISPTTTHLEVAKAALDTGKNVLVEKPMARTSKECEEMIDTARKNGRTLTVFHGLEFLDSIRNTKAILNEEGLRTSRMRFSYFFAQPYPGFTPSWVFSEETGGILWEALVHHVYLAEYFFGKPQSVYAVVNRFRSPVPDSLTLILQSNGTPAICEYEWNVKETQRTFQLMTTSGDRFDLDLSHDFMRRKSRMSGGRWRSAYLSLSDDISAPIHKWGRHVHRFLSTLSYSKGLPMEKAYFCGIGNLVSYLLGSSNTPPITAAEGRDSIATLEAAARSMTSQQVEPVG